jgi:anionic cell wall polymer biosynthesis LytR-Cps2A-Psr (LCP) family protein
VVKLGPIAVGKLGYGVACAASALALVGAGYAHEVFSLTDSLGYGVGLGDSPSFGAMNVLVMGLESRTNFQGQDLSVQQLTETHSGNETQVEEGLEGSQDTDTLILIHIYANGTKAVGFSIPRDDVVNYPHEVWPNGMSEQGYTEGKIDAAYAYAYDQSLEQTDDSTMSSSQRYLDANQAGQLFQVQTIESVTGVHIDHFIESNIIGFYELAEQFGGLEVCIQPAPAQGGFAPGANMTDYDPLVDPPSDNSGFSAYEAGYNRKKGGKQYLHLSAAMSLAYVRSRDTLPGVDIGRTARQQAAIQNILWQMKTRGVLSDITDIPTMLNNAKSYLMYDSGLDLIDFAQDMRALSGSNLSFTTLPEISTNDVEVPGLGSQSANYIDVPQIQQQVAQAFYGTSVAPSTASSVTVDVYNGGSTSGLAGDVSQDLTAMGYKAGAVADSSSQSQPVQDDAEVFYGAGSAAQANAQVIANVMGVQTTSALSSLPAGHVEVLLGSQVGAQAPGLEMFGADTVNASDYVTAAQQNGQSIPAGVQAAANANSSSEVPAYSESKATPTPAPTSSSSAKPATSDGKPATKTATKHATTKHAPAKQASTTAPANPNPPWGLTTCPY